MAPLTTLTAPAADPSAREAKARARLIALRAGGGALVALAMAATAVWGEHAPWLALVEGAIAWGVGKLLGVPLAEVTRLAMHLMATERPETAARVAIKTLQSLPPERAAHATEKLFASLPPEVRARASMAPAPSRAGIADGGTIIEFVDDFGGPSDPTGSQPLVFDEPTRPTRPDRPRQRS